MGVLEIILIMAAIILTALGIIGCVVPGLPGPLFSYLSLITLHFADEGGVFSTQFLIIWLVVIILISALDYVMPVYATKRFGGTRYGVIGGVIGLLIGIFLFPPFGIILGPLIGAIIGDLVAGKQFESALRSGLGSFIGFLAATTIKLAVSITIAVFLVINLVKIIGDDLNIF